MASPGFAALAAEDDESSDSSEIEDCNTEKFDNKNIDNESSISQQETTESKTSSNDANNNKTAHVKNNKKKKKSKNQKSKPPSQEENLDHLDDMAFLDIQVEKAQNAHGREINASGKGYRTIVNGILNAGPPPRAPSNATKNASSALHAKLQQAKASRTAKSTKKKKK